MLCSKRAACSAPVAAFTAVPRKTQNSTAVSLPLFSEKGECRSRAVVAWAAEAAPITAPKTDMKKYETLIVLKPTLTDEERDQELARFESFLLSENCQDVKAMVRGRHRMAYPVKGNWEGIYVLFSFLAQPSTAPKVQILLSNPIAGAEDNILRHMTLNY